MRSDSRRNLSRSRTTVTDNASDDRRLSGKTAERSAHESSSAAVSRAANGIQSNRGRRGGVPPGNHSGARQSGNSLVPIDFIQSITQSAYFYV